MQSYKQHLPEVTLPPEPVSTRWGACIEVVNFCSEHIETVKLIVAKFSSESAVSVRGCQCAFRDPEVACSIANIR
jgi:hypothetical protein